MLLPLLSNTNPALKPRDSHGRSIGYLRLSLTRACQMRCTYCRPTFDRNESRDEITVDEIESISRHLVQNFGVTKVRLTGGDPTARTDLLHIIKRLASIPGLNDLAMTTNGLTLATHAAAYRDAGLSRLNVSLDTLDPVTFAEMTGTNTCFRVLEGIRRAAGIFPGKLKLNTVVLRNQNLQHLPDLLDFAVELGVEIRFIELMPMGPLAANWEDRFVAETEMRQVLDARVDHWTMLPTTKESARRFVATLHDGREATVGFITPMSCNFCSNCDRLRIASDGAIYPCLMDAPAGNLMSAIRPAFSADRFDAAIAAAYADKRAEHPHDGVATMTHIGG